ncbi:uncharacterized protein EI90DRAFT_3131373 [Cantharellus anzutake]|uniref:uncharacterized protein n=1 Tax=Cantharellus anzutake TaxID=1750568 RepID=UPI001905EF0B|nr:uncharacterized protein EI90DRAFT_3131373 [Cantharellus anzutake]KAF8321930.1 hypothetical protein EI90DRAFT_3131373 [Cantharellus anzutake]
MSRVIRTHSQTCGLIIDVTPRAGTSSGHPIPNRCAGAESPSPISHTIPSTTSSRSSSERRSPSLCSNFDRVVASSMHDSAVFVEAVNEDGLVPHEPVPIPPIPILVGDDDEVEQVPVPVLTQFTQAITHLARSTACPTPIPVPVPAPVQPPTPSTSLRTKV